jgi:hypothetical protein
MENNEEHVPIFFEGISTFCPICNQPVRKVTETDWEPKNMVVCESEYYVHYGDKLVKFKTPKHDYYK